MPLIQRKPGGEAYEFTRNQPSHNKFETQQGTVSAVRDVSYHLEEGEVLGIVGESGSGKVSAC